jgi:riboflavin synthase
MFSGIIEEIGVVKELRLTSDNVWLEIQASEVLCDSKIGDSISVDGVCLTIAELRNNSFVANAMPVSLQTTTLSNFKNGDRVNLERALTYNGRIGGHLVSGHVDTTAMITNITSDQNAILIDIDLSEEHHKYIIDKGSVAVDGISLTVAKKRSSGFTVSLIPHTVEVSTLAEKNIGDKLNIELDMIAKYLYQFITIEEKGVSFELLTKKGFI